MKHAPDATLPGLSRAWIVRNSPHQSEVRPDLVRSRIEEYFTNKEEAMHYSGDMPAVPISNYSPCPQLLLLIEEREDASFYRDWICAKRNRH